MKRLMALLILCFSANLCMPCTAEESGSPAFDSLKKLAGTWSGKDEDNQPVTVTYEVSSGGTIVIEKLQTGTYPCMTSVYHKDGDSVLMTHYCNLNNQPRMRLKKFDAEKGVIDFDFLDITNLKNEKAAHIRTLTMTLPDDKHMVHDWTCLSDGKLGHAIFKFERVKEIYEPGSGNPSKPAASNEKKGWLPDEPLCDHGKSMI